MKGRMFKVVAATLLWMLGHAAYAGTVTYVYTDPQGTPLAEADASGNITATFDYRPYGAQALGSLHDGTGYTGHISDADSSLIYMRARYYDPVTARFLSIDPKLIGAGDIFSFNEFMYADGNPITNIDPNGEETNPVSRASYITNAQLRTNRSNPNVGKFGMSRSSGNWNGGFHNGVDIAAHVGTSLVAPISGAVSVTSAGLNPRGGNVVWITKSENGHTVKIGMAHLSSFSVGNGEQVQEGQQIAASGDTGNANGLPADEQHVHLTVRVDGRFTDPQGWFQQHPSNAQKQTPPPPPSTPPPPPPLPQPPRQNPS